MSIWTHPISISWKYPAALVAACLLTLSALWLSGLNQGTPTFRLNPHDAGELIPLHQSWWQSAANWIHGRRYLLLTFDDGPADAKTHARILQILAKHHAHAIFFTICGRVDIHGHVNAMRADELRADIAAGDVVGDHTFTHPQLPTLSRKADLHQITGCQHFLHRITGRPIHWFRPPFGESSPTVLSIVKHDDMQLMMWLDNSEDTWQKTPADIVHWSTTMAGNGYILLMHSYKTTADALDRNLTALQRMGYHFLKPRRLWTYKPPEGS